MPVSAHVFGPYPNGKKWRIVVKEGPARKSVCVASREEAERLKADLLRTFLEPGPTRIAVAIDDYLLSRRQGGVREISLRTMESRLRLFLPAEEPIGSLTPQRAQALYEKETERIARFGRTVSATTHRGTLKLARSFFRWAVERRLIRANPFDAVKPVGKPAAGKRQLRIDEARALHDWLLVRAQRGEDGALALLLQLLLGLRSSEVLQRVARDLDDGGRVLWIPHGKTHNARRRLEVPEELRPLLVQKVQGAAPERPIFPGESGRPHYNSWIFRRMREACDGAGVPRVCPHSLRGLHSTLAIEAGATSGLVAAALGHGSFAITARHYTDPSALRNAASRRVSSALSASPKLDTDALIEMLRALEPSDLDRVLASVGARR